MKNDLSVINFEDECFFENTAEKERAPGPIFKNIHCLFLRDLRPMWVTQC